MPNNNISKIIFTCVIVLLMLKVGGQPTRKLQACDNKDWQFNYNLGFTEFYGDASTYGYFKKFSGEIAFATGLMVQKHFNPSFALGVTLWYSGIKSKKDKRATGIPTNFILEGKYFDGTINLQVDFSNLLWGAKNRRLSVYGKVGMGYSGWSSTLADSITGTIINSGDTIGTGYYKKGGFVVPVALGINYMLSNNLGLNFEMNLRTILNDDVDVWRDGFKYDQLLYTSIGISYYINAKAKNKRRSVKRDAPIKPVMQYDYISPPDNQSSSAITNAPEVILIDAPVEKKVEIPSGIIFRVQIFATRTKMQSFSYLREKFNIIGDIYENYQDGVYRYSTGSYNSYQEALNNSKIMKNKGVTDAFVVAYKRDIRIVITTEMKNY